MLEPTTKLDTRGLNCPLPILKTKKAISSLESGDILEVTSTDPGSVKDLDSFCSQTGHSMISNQETCGEFIFLIRKA